MIGNHYVNIINVIIASIFVSLFMALLGQKGKKVLPIICYLAINVLLIIILLAYSGTLFYPSILVLMVLFTIVICRDIALILFAYTSIPPSREKNAFMIILPLSTVFYMVPFAIFRQLLYVSKTNSFQWLFIISIGQMIFGHEGTLYSSEKQYRPVGIFFFLSGFSFFLLAVYYLFEDTFALMPIITAILFCIYILLMYICFKFGDGVVKDYGETVED